MLNTATKAGLDALTTDSKKVAQKAAETTGEFLENKSANKSLMKIQEMLKKQSLQQRKQKKHYGKYQKIENPKISKLLSNSLVSKFVT